MQSLALLATAAVAAATSDAVNAAPSLVPPPPPPASASAVGAITLRSATGVRACVLIDPRAPNATAVGEYKNTVQTLGWGILHVKEGLAAAAASPEDVAFAAGCAEGALTAQEMADYWNNYAAAEYGPSGPSANLTAFMSQQEAWLRGIAASSASAASLRGAAAGAASSSPLAATFATGAGRLLAQFDGLVAGYAAAGSPGGLSHLDLFMLNSVGDLEDLNTIYAAVEKTGEEEEEDAPMPLKDKLTDCSAIITALPGSGAPGARREYAAGHTTWRSYYAMLRTYKVYALPSVIPTSPISFSSSPGLLHSKDDFYATGAFVTMETTNSIYDRSLYSKVTPQSALSWQRVWVANALAPSLAAATNVSFGSAWTSLMAYHQSGTYNNQWMAFVPPTGPLNATSRDVLWIVEGIPGLVQAGDVTPILAAQGYWASYNIPFFTSVYNASGYPAMAARYGAQYTYDGCDRARIFARNATALRSVSDVQSLMRYNDWQVDPLAGGDPILGAVSARGDLNPGKPVAFGGIDSKVVSSYAMGGDEVTVLAQSGPSYDQQPVFEWSAFPQWAGVARAGVPDAFSFPWVSIRS